MVQKKGGGGSNRVISEEGDDELARIPLQAILLADSFAQKFRPITLERPKVLLPLLNIPMIDYTLAWLESAGVEEVFVFCCAHSRQVIDYLEGSKWFGQPNFSLKPIESHNCVSAGDALRYVYEQSVIHGDFVLISGDTLSNMSLTQALADHKERRKKDTQAVMTMIIKKSKISPLTRQSRLGTDELFMGIDPDTKQLLYYEDMPDNAKGTLSLDKLLLADNPSLSMHNDMQDCYIDICCPEVLSLFFDNFDYQHLRRHFVKGLLVDDVKHISEAAHQQLMGYKIFTHEIHSSYAARIDNFRSYDTISKDIIQRWPFPYVPDVQFSGNSVMKWERQGMYRSSDIDQSRSAEVGPFTAIGNNTSIGHNTKIVNSVIGEGCKIGSNVLIEGSYVLNNVTIEDGCQLKHAIVCDCATIKSGAILEPGVVLSFKVVIGHQFVVPAYAKVSLLPQPKKQDSDEELEYPDDSYGTNESPSFTYTSGHLSTELAPDLSESRHFPIYEVGAGGVGYIWSVAEGGYEDELRQSVAPIPRERIVEIKQAAINEINNSDDDDDPLPPYGDLQPDVNSIDSEDVTVDSRDDYHDFEKEVELTFLRAVHENIKEDHVILEVNSLRLSYNKTSVDCASALFYSMMKLALESPRDSIKGLFQNTTKEIDTWQKLLKYYLPSVDEEIEVILKFEEMCSESAREFSPVFVQILHHLYDNGILKEEAILNWASEKEGADESDKVYLKQSETFIRWLNEASEESEEED